MLTTVSAAGRMMFGRSVRARGVRLGTPRHAAAAALALGAIGGAISAHARAIAGECAIFVAVVISAARRNARSVHARILVADAAIAADEPMIAIWAAVGAMFDTAIAADEPMIAIRAAVGAMFNTTVAAD
ncbi:MAG: hypothetical protein WA197_21035 [Candidatus Acidiferrales bacterium]